MANLSSLSVSIVPEDYPFINRDRVAPRLRLRDLSVPIPVYNSYSELYNAAAKYVYSLKRVLDHPEHKKIIQMVADSGLSMPDVAPVREQIRVLEELLSSYGPDEVLSITRHEGGEPPTIRLPFNTAVCFHKTFIETSRLIALAFPRINQAHYQACFTVLKKEGIPYEGPKSIDEMYQTWLALIRNQATHNSSRLWEEKLPANWMECAQ